MTHSWEEGEEIAGGTVERVQQAIYLIRGQRVMLDKDLAKLYGVETRVLNQAVRRNADRFPADFLFRLTREEIVRISQFVTSSDVKFSKNVYAFNEHGAIMAANVLVGRSTGSRKGGKRSPNCPEPRLQTHGRYF